jgi:hypothetical protein
MGDEQSRPSAFTPTWRPGICACVFICVWTWTSASGYFKHFGIAFAIVPTAFLSYCETGGTTHDGEDHERSIPAQMGMEQDAAAGRPIDEGVLFCDGLSGGVETEDEVGVGWLRKRKWGGRVIEARQRKRRVWCKWGGREYRSI